MFVFLKNDEPQIIEMKVGCVEPCGAVRNYKERAKSGMYMQKRITQKAYFKFF